MKKEMKGSSRRERERELERVKERRVSKRSFPPFAVYVNNVGVSPISESRHPDNLTLCENQGRQLVLFHTTMEHQSMLGRRAGI